MGAEPHREPETHSALKAYLLIPVPMNLDDERWCNSTRHRACVVHHFSEAQARVAASEHFAPVPGLPVRYPWNDPRLVWCSDQGTVPGSAPGTVTTAVREAGQRRRTTNLILGAIRRSLASASMKRWS